MGPIGRMMRVIREHYDNSLENIGNYNSFVWMGPLWCVCSIFTPCSADTICAQGTGSDSPVTSLQVPHDPGRHPRASHRQVPWHADLV